MNTDWFFFTIFFSGVLGFLVSGILVFVNKTDSFPSRLLAGFLVCFSLLAFNYALMTTRFFLAHPHLWRVVGWASFSFAPLSYLYVRSVLHQSYRFRKTDFLLFIPALLHPLSLIPFYILPASEKVKFLESVVADPRLVVAEPETILPPGTFAWLRVAVGVLATIGQFLSLSAWRNKFKEKLLLNEQNIGTFKWLFLFSVVMAIFWVLIIIQFFFYFSAKLDLNYFLIFTIAGTILFVSLYLLVRPSILYGIKGWAKEYDRDNSTTEKAIISDVPVLEDSKKTYLSFDQGKVYKELLEKHFELNLPFRKRGYTIADLSREIGIPGYLLSAFINQQYGKNFNELVNEYRVNYLVNEFRTSTDFSQFTLEALGKLAGFNSRAAFIASVKKVTGKNPSELFGRRGEKLYN